MQYIILKIKSGISVRISGLKALEWILNVEGKRDFCVHFEKESIILEEINGNNGGKYLPRYLEDFKCVHL